MGYARSGNSAFSPSGEAFATPRSVMRPVTRRAGVTSKAGLAARLPSGAMRTRATAPVRAAPLHELHFVGVPLLDRDLLHAVAHRPVDGRGGQGDIEGHGVVLRRERLQIGADLVADVAIGGGAVRADDHHVDEAALHQVAAGVVDDERMGRAMVDEFPGGERGALVARARFVDIDVDRKALLHGAIDRGGGGAVIDRREPAGVAMGEDVDRLAGFLRRGEAPDDRRARCARSRG